MGLRKRLRNLHHTEITEDTEIFFKAYSLVMPQKKYSEPPLRGSEYFS